MNQSLSASETRSIIQARIEGVQPEQTAAINRLRGLGVPEPLIRDAAHASGIEYLDAESAIIFWASREWNFPEASVLLILNGKADPVQTA